MSRAAVLERLHRLERSAAAFARSERLIPGGVGSNDRALIHPHPIFITHGRGSRLWDVDGNCYIDYLLGYGPLVLGHAHPRLIETVSRTLTSGSMFGAPHPLEPEVAELLVDLIPSFEMVRFSQSGTEAVLTAMRLARAATGRPLILKFEGHYHGWADQVALSYAPTDGEAGSIEHPRTALMSQGQVSSAADDVVVLGWNDLEAVECAFAERGHDIAGILTEPVMCNHGIIEPEAGYLEGLRRICDAHGAVLIFDEVQTAFRLHLHGAQGLLGVQPDLTCLGKALSGGFPISAIGGRADIMEQIADRRVFHAGTYNSNPACLAAIPVVVAELSQDGVYETMARLSHRLRDRLAHELEPVGGYVQGSTTVFGPAFGPGPVRNMRDAWRNDPHRVMHLKRELRLRGVYTKPTPRDIWYVSTAHTEEDIDRTLEIAADAIRALR